jgi:hypothetical protein
VLKAQTTTVVSSLPTSAKAKAKAKSSGIPEDVRRLALSSASSSQSPPAKAKSPPSKSDSTKDSRPQKKPKPPKKIKYIQRSIYKWNLTYNLLMMHSLTP